MNSHAKASAAKSGLREWEKYGEAIHTMDLRACSRSLAALLLLTGLFLSLTPAGAFASKGIHDYFPKTVGIGTVAGQFSAPHGVAINETTGDIYVVDGTNQRVQQFDSEGQFIRMWGKDVDSTGGTGFEICEAEALCKSGSIGTGGGEFQFPRGIAIDQTTGDLYVSEQNNRRVQKFSSAGVWQRAWGKNVVGVDEQQRLVVSATGGNYTLTFGANTTSSIAFNASAVTVRNALRALPSIGSPNVNVSGNLASGYTITFVGALAATNVAQITANPGGLTGGASTATVTTLADGFGGPGNIGFEICTVASQCGPGATGALGGEFGGDLTTAVAVVPAGAPNSGQIIVADPANRRVQAFDADGNFISIFGFDVAGPGGGADNTGTGFEVCTQAVAGASQCKIGTAGSGTGQFSSNEPSRVAVDSSGAIYAVERTGNFRVQKFAPQVGPPQFAPSVFAPATLSGTAGSDAPGDVAIGSSDEVFVVKAFPTGAGVPPAGTDEQRIIELDSSGVLQDTHLAGFGFASINGLGADPGSTRLAITTEMGAINRVWVLDDAVAATATISTVMDIGARTATFHGQVNPGNALASWHFEYSDNGIIWTPFPSEDADAGAGTEPVSVSRTVPGRLKPNTAYQVRLVVTRPFGSESVTSEPETFMTLEAPPEIVEQVPVWVDQTKATLRARIEPAGQATTYHFEWGPDPSDYVHRIPADHELFAGDGTDPVTVDAELSGLSGETKLYFRVVATNPSGTTVGGDQPFETLNDLGLLGGRRYELVSPPDKGLAGQAGEPVLGPNSHPVFASPDGNRVAYPVAYATPDANGGDEPVFIAQRDAGGWTSEEWSPPVMDQSKFEEYTNPSTPYFISRNLECGFLGSLSSLTADPAALPVLEGGGTNLYRQTGVGEFALVSNATPTNPTAEFELPYLAYSVIGAAESCDRVIFSSLYRYPGLDSSFEGDPFQQRYLYQWESGALSNPAVIPGPGGPEFAAVAYSGAKGMASTATAHNVVSEDGSRFFFTATSKAGGDTGQDAVFMREDNATAVDISQSQTATPNNGPARFEMATPSGDFAFFKARYGLAPNGSSTGANSCDASATGTGLGAGCDLYRYEADTGELLDISVSTNPEDTGGAAVAGVLDVSVDGSRVYFAAKGQLVVGEGQTYAENIGASSAGYNIYLWDDGALSFVATVAQEDVTGGGGLGPRGLIASHPGNIGSLWSSDATPDGGRLVFLSRSNLTGYPAGAAAQVYIHSADDGALRCISCPRDGQPSLGESLSNPLLHAVLNDKASRISSYMSDDGSRVFFQSTDALAPGAVSGETNYYEWQEGQIALLAADPLGSLLTRVAYVTPSGGNDDTVFLSSTRGYVPWDTDGRRDVYAVRVGGGFAGPPTPPTPCDPLADACQGGATAPPAAPAPGSATFSGPGNSIQLASKKKHKKQKKCKKRKKCKKQGTSKRGRK